MPMSTRPLYQGLRWHHAVIVEGSTSYEWVLRESGMLPDSTVSAGDPRAWQRRHGPIPAHGCVLLLTGDAPCTTAATADRRQRQPSRVHGFQMGFTGFTGFTRLRRGLISTDG